MGRNRQTNCVKLYRSKNHARQHCTICSKSDKRVSVEQSKNIAVSVNGTSVIKEVFVHI